MLNSQKLPYIVISLIVISGCAQDHIIANDINIEEVVQAAHGTLQGTVTIGPLCPIEPCNLPPERIAQVYQARKVIIYEQSTKRKVTQKNLNPSGEYVFSLKPDRYIVDISDAQGNTLPLDLTKRPRIGNTLPKETDIKASDIAVINFDIDTGIR